MILIRSRLFRYYHYVKPTLSSIKNIQDLEKIMQKRLVRSIKNSNQERLKHYNIRDALKNHLAIQAQLIEDIKQRTVKHTIINSATQQYRLVDALIDQKIESLDIQGFDVTHPFYSSNDALHHFSQKRGAPNFQQLKEYDFQSPALYIFNLPINITSQDIKGSLPTLLQTKVDITFKYCLLGLPAYAKIEFQSEQKLNEVINKLKSKEINFGDRVGVIKSPQDAQKMRLGWRRMVVHLEEDSKFDKYLVNFSKYGRVLHLQWPIELSLNPTIEQVKKFYANSTQLIKLNIIQKDGTIQSEYYPPLSVWSVNQDNRGEENYLERAEKLKESYENRTRFAKNVNVKIGKQNKIEFNNKGYCVVTYSTFQQCQNFYFSHGSDSKMQLVEGKLDFQFDPLFKKQLLRQIDNDYLIGKKKSYEQKLDLKKTYLDPVKQGLDVFDKNLQTPKTYGEQIVEQDNYKIAQRIFNRMCVQQLVQAPEIKSWYMQNYKNGNDPITQWTMYLQKFKETKKQMNKKSFDELAEQELFGRVLPKDDNIERFVVDNEKYKEMRQIQLARDNLLLTTFRQLQVRQKFYKRAFERNNRLAVEAEGMNIAIEQSPEDDQQLVPDEVTPGSDGTSIGKHSFSTFRPAPLYRKRTVEEEANFQIRYNQFLRSTIYEYMGVFQDKLIEEAAQFRSQLVNPHSLKWQNGQSYLSQNDVLRVLQFRRDFSNAQIEYQDFVYGSQYIKSKGLSPDSINSNYKNYEQKALRYLSDVGIVEDVKKVKQTNLQEKVDILNAEIATFGEQYRIDEINGEKMLVKVRKYEHILSLDRIDHLQQFVNEHGNDITPQQSAVFEKHYLQMKQNGTIPNQVCDAFGVQKGKTLKDLLSQVGSLYKIQKKDLQMAERAKTMSKEDINSDINNQINLQKARAGLRKLNSDQFAKDPSQIYAKDQQGYYKVSRYRQI